MTIYSESFSATSGSWDTTADWSQKGIPDQNTAVLIGPAATLVTAAGTDVFATLDAIGSTAGGAGNTLAITGTLTDPSNNAGIDQITNFTVDVAKGASLTAPQIANFSGSVLDDFGSVSLTGGGGLADVLASTITIEAGASLAASEINGLVSSSLNVQGAVSLSAGGGVINAVNSTITIGPAGTLTTAELNGNATDTLIVGGHVTFNTTGGDNLNGTHVTISAGGTLTNDGYDSYGQGFNINGGTFIGADAYATDSFNFGGVAGGVVELENNNRYSENFTVSNFAKGDMLILGTITNNDSPTVGLNNGTLTIRDLSIPTSPYYTDPNIVFEDNNFTLAAGTSLSDLRATIVNGHVELCCFYPGTMLATPDGEIAVEAITAGTLLLTAAGDARPVCWLGRSTVSTRFADPLRALPIRMAAGALGAGLPARDLLVSPCHAMYIEGVLIQAGALVNGVSITREADVPEVFTYYHVELATHELLLAEGAPAESFVDNVDRMNFDNWAAHQALGATTPMEELPYPRAKAPRQVPAAIRRRLAARLELAA